MPDLRYSTAVSVIAGPFVDETDGATAEVGLNITRGDTWLGKNGATMASRVALGSGVHTHSGMYKVPLGTTDTNTLGRLRMYHKFGGTALPDWRDFDVITQAEWDRKYATSTINGIVTSVLGTYDPPTHTEVTSGFTALNDVSSSQVKTQVQSALATYDAPTDAEMTSQITALNDPTASQVAIAVSGALTANIPANVIQIEGADATSQLAAAADSAIVANALDHIAAVGAGGSWPLQGTWLWQIMHKSPASAGFSQATDSLEALADNKATPSQVLTQAKSALATYDAPTHTEMNSGFTALNDPTASAVATSVSGVLTIPTSAAIKAAVMATNALTSDVISADAAQYLADQWMLRKTSTVAEASINSPRTLGGAMLPFMNKTSTVGSVLYVYKADDATVAWSATLTLDSAATQIVGINP